MDSRDKNIEDEYTVGFAKPPKSTQFRKGASGNPKGRPKGSKNLTSIFLKESGQLVGVNGPRGTRKVTKLEAAAIQLSNKAAQGDLRAMRELLPWVQRSEVAIAAQPGPEYTPEADRKMMQSILKRMKEVPNTKNTTTKEEK